MTNDDLIYRSQNCDMPLPQGFGMQYGWVCPKCGRVLAPWVSECSCYKGCSTAASTTIPLSNVDKFSESIKINNINPNTDKDGDIK